MNRISHPCHKKRRCTSSRAAFCVAFFLLSLPPVYGKTLRAPAPSVPVQSKVTVVGILAFQDETDTGAPPDLGKKIAQQLKQRLSLSFKDVLPKSLNPNSDAPSTAALTVEQVVALGKQNAVQFVVRAGILSLAVVESNITAQLYAEIISVESGAVSVVRAEGTGSGGSIQWSEIDLNSASFSSSAPGTALAVGIESLATSIHQALRSPVVEASSAETPATGTVETTPPADAAAADADEELRQLIAQAEEVVGSGGGDTDRLKPISSALETLKAALASKASLIEGGADPTESDQKIAAAKTEVQAALTVLNEQAASAGANSEEGAPPTGEKKGLLAAIDQRASEALGILHKIQEMRAAFRAVKEDPNAGGAASEGSALEASEQPTEDVSGVVMEAGEPLAGVEVTDQDSDVTAITGPDGSYTLKALPAGKLSTLVLKKNGKQIAMGQIDLLRGRSSVADFEVKSKMAPAASALRIIPSTIVLKGNPKTGARGILKGAAKDQAGKPLGRALVRLEASAKGQALPQLYTALTKNESLAVARTDSQGRYTFLNVPADEYLVTVRKSGLSPVSTRVSVKPKVATEAQSRLTAVPKSAARDRQRAIVQGTGSKLRGRVLDTEGKPVAGAKVLFLQSSSAASVLTSRAGDYEVKDLRAGSYTVLASKLGYENSNRKITVHGGRTESENFQLRRKDSPYIGKLIAARTNRPSPPRDPAPRLVTPVRPVQSAARGDLTGRVLDALSRKPIAGATVLLPGRRARTDQAGNFDFADLAPGVYLVKVTSNGFSEVEQSVTIRAGATSRDQFALKPLEDSKRMVRVVPEAPRVTTPARFGQVRGRVVDAASGAPIAGAVVAVSGQQRAITGRDGSYSLNSLPPGSYQVSISRVGFAEKRTTFTIRAGEVTDASFRLTAMIRKPTQ